MKTSASVDRNLLVQLPSTRGDSASTLPTLAGDSTPPSGRAETSTFAITRGASDWLQLDLDDIVQELCGWNTLLAIVFMVLILLIFLQKSYDLSFWSVMFAGSLFAVFYVYWVCIRSPSQYYEQISSGTANYYHTRASMSNTPGGEPAELETTDDIINTTTYQAAPAFGRGSILGANRTQRKEGLIYL